MQICYCFKNVYRINIIEKKVFFLKILENLRNNPLKSAELLPILHITNLALADNLVRLR